MPKKRPLNVAADDVVVVGTGMAGGIIIDGELYEGRNCGAGEFGMIRYRDHYLEYYCSGQFFGSGLGRHI